MKDEPNPVPPPDSSNSNATSSSNSNADNAQPPPPPLPSVPSPAPARVFSPSHSSRMPPEFSSPGLPPPQPSSLNVSPPPPLPSSLNVSLPPERIKPQPKSLEPTYEEKERNQPDQTVELNGQQVKVKPKLWQKDTLGKKDASGQFTETDPEFNARQDVDKTRYFSDAEREQRKVTFTPISPEQQRQAEQANLSGNQLPPNFQPKPNVSLHHMETKRVPTPEGQMKIDAAEKAAKEAKAQQEEAEIRAARLRTEEKRRNRFVPRPQSQTPPFRLRQRPFHRRPTSPTRRKLATTTATPRPRSHSPPYRPIRVAQWTQRTTRYPSLRTWHPAFLAGASEGPCLAVPCQTR